MNSNIALEIKGLTKKYGDKVVVNGVSLQIMKGECFGILGPNGAGKSTLMKMLYGSVNPLEGDLYVLGLNSRKSILEVKSRIGVVPQEDGLDVEFTARENLLIYSRFYGIDTKIAQQRVEELLRLMRLEEVSDHYVQSLSGGMKRRLAIARGMINRPDLLFLDEPTTGLDPQARLWIWGFLKKIKADMGTVVVTTHYMEEAENICDRIAIMDQGIVLALGTPAQLVDRHVGIEVVEFESDTRHAQYDIDRIKNKGLDFQVIGTTVRIYVKSGSNGRDVLSLISSQEITIRRPNLNDVFLKLAGHDLREEIL
jgi:lipooligosaccharide transport system ATP-binding protein